MYGAWYLHFFYPEMKMLPGIYFEQFLFFVLHLVIRSFIIAVRYSFCSELRFLMLKSAIQNENFISRDLLMPGWL